MTPIFIDLPDDLAQTIGKDKLAHLALEALAVKLYQMGEIGSGKGASLLGISRRAFLDLLGRYNVSIFDENMDIAEELRNAEQGLRG